MVDNHQTAAAASCNVLDTDDPTTTSWYQDLNQLETWKDRKTLIQVMKRFQPQMYQSRLEIAFDHEQPFTSSFDHEQQKHSGGAASSATEVVELSSLLNDSNYCKQFSKTLQSSSSECGVGGCWNENWSNNLILYSGNITHLKNCDHQAVVNIVNPCNESLIIGGGLNGTIFNACGKTELEHSLSDPSQWKYKSFKQAEEEEEGINQINHHCPVGEIVVTSAFKMKESNGIENIIHTCGPKGTKDIDLENRLLLSNCYMNSLRFFINNYNSTTKTTLILPCISTGKFRYPKIEACCVALGTVRDFIIGEYMNEKSLIHNTEWKIIFTTFTPQEQAIYECFMNLFF